MRVVEGVVPPGTLLRVGDTILRVGESADSAPRGELFASEQLGGMVGRSPAMRRVMAQVSRLARAIKASS